MLRTWLRGELVGVDEYGNRYYRERGDRDRRGPGGAGSGAGWCSRATPIRRACRRAGSAGCTGGSSSRRASSRCRRRRWEKERAAESDRHAGSLSAARRDRARRAARTGDRRLRGLAAGVGQGSSGLQTSASRPAPARSPAGRCDSRGGALRPGDAPALVSCSRRAGPRPSAARARPRRDEEVGPGQGLRPREVFERLGVALGLVPLAEIERRRRWRPDRSADGCGRPRPHE